MVGGGNIFRGRLADDWGIERAEADNIGIMATVINSLILRGVLNAKGVPDVRVMTAIPTPSVAEPYIRLRAIRHLEKGRLRHAADLRRGRCGHPDRPGPGDGARLTGGSFTPRPA